MNTPFSTGRAIEVPNLVGVRAGRAIEMLRKIGLLPITWAAAVKDVNQAGFVLRLDPPPGTQVRPKALIAMSVAAHPDFVGYADDLLPGDLDKGVEPTQTTSETDGRCAISLVERPDDLNQIQGRGFLQMQLW